MLLLGAMRTACLRQDFRQAHQLCNPSQMACKIQLKTINILALQGLQARSESFKADLQAFYARACAYLAVKGAQGSFKDALAAS